MALHKIEVYVDYCLICFVCVLQCVELTHHLMESGQKQLIEHYAEVSQKLEDNLLCALILLEGRNSETTEKLTSILSMCTSQVSALPVAVTDALQPISGKELLNAKLNNICVRCCMWVCYNSSSPCFFDCYMVEITVGMNKRGAICYL